MDVTKFIPRQYLESAYKFRDEFAWSRDPALRVVDSCTKQGIAVTRVEIWIPTENGPIIPSPVIYAWEPLDDDQTSQRGEFVRDTNESAKKYITEFEWDRADLEHMRFLPYFNLWFVENPTEPHAL